MARYDYKVTTAEGEIITRSSDRVYTFAAVWTKDGGRWMVSFCRTRELAEKARPTFSTEGHLKTVYPVEVVKDRGVKGEKVVRSCAQLEEKAVAMACALAEAVAPVIPGLAAEAAERMKANRVQGAQVEEVVPEITIEIREEGDNCSGAVVSGGEHIAGGAKVEMTGRLHHLIIGMPKRLREEFQFNGLIRFVDQTGVEFYRALIGDDIERFVDEQCKANPYM